MTELISTIPQSLTYMNYIDDWEKFLNEYMLKSKVNSS